MRTGWGISVMMDRYYYTDILFLKYRLNMLSRLQKPSLRDFMLMQGQTRSRLCLDGAIFDPCDKLTELSSFEKATLSSWSSDSNVDKGLNLYILLHFLSAVNSNSYYYHYVNNGSSDGTNMFGHVIGTSGDFNMNIISSFGVIYYHNLGSGKSSALTPHMDALNRTLSQMDINQEYIQHANKSIDLLFEQPFIVSNSTALQVFRSLLYGNRLLCSTECDTLLSNLGVYGNQYNDPRFAENVNMLIQMFDGTKHQNRATLSTSYNIPEGRRASIIGASVGDPYARVSQQHYEANGVSGAHNRFTHYPCPVMKAIKTNSGTSGVISNMVPSLQHIYTTSFLLGKIEYIARQNVYDKYEKKESNVIDSDVEEKWKRLRPTANRQYHRLSSKIEIQLEEPESDSSYEHSKSAHYYMFSRVYNQWKEATETEKEEHEAIISFKNSTKIPRFICNFARFRAIMDILWDDDVYPFIEISEVVKTPYLISNYFIEAVNKVIDKRFPPYLRKDDGTKILIIEKSTAIMGDLFFGHVDYVSRQLFDLSSIQEKFITSPVASRSFKSIGDLQGKCCDEQKKHNDVQKTHDNVQKKRGDRALMYDDALTIISSKFIFFSLSTFNTYRQFHNDKDRLTNAIKYLVDNELIYQPLNKERFIKGTRSSYVMATPTQIQQNNMSIEALTELKLNINDYRQIWKQCLFSTTDIAGKIDKPAIDYISSNLFGFIEIIHRLGDANDPIAQEILKPGLRNGLIGIDPETQTFTLSPVYAFEMKDNRYIMKQLNKLCVPAISQKNDSSKNERTSLILDSHRSNNSNATMIDLTESDKVNMTSLIIDDVQELQTQLEASKLFSDIHSNKNNSMNNLKEQVSLNGKGNRTASMSSINSIITEERLNTWDALEDVLVNNNEKDNVVNNDEKITHHTTCTNEEYNSSTCDINKSLTTAFNSVIVEEMSTNYNMNMSSSVEYDYFVDDSMNIRDSDTSLQSQQQENSELILESSSLIAIEQQNDEQHSNAGSNSIEYDFHSNLKTTSSPNTTSSEYSDVSKDADEISNKELIALSKKFMLKPFIAFTKTDVTRLYNNAETKNRVIAYLKQSKLITPIDNLFVSNIPTKKKIKFEIGYLKMFPISTSASEASSFETKLRTKVGIGLDEYVDKVLNNETSSTPSSIVNNIFNTAHHNWLLNRHWYDKIIEGEISVYFQDKVKCPEQKISSVVVALTTVSNDDVTDSFDQPRSNLTPAQRTNNELRRLGAKRQKQPTNEPPTKRQRKPKRFPDEDNI
ncbi:hypothetical protein I4U23_005304 [Adineta vaga]|nr:hypothetical protein I4U23_005304 [Adineta vaga]